MPAVLCEVLWDWYQYRKKQEFLTGISFTAPTDYVFATNQGKMRNYYGIETIFKRFLQRNNLSGQNITLRSLRQTYSNILYAKNVNPADIAVGLRHTKSSTGLENYRDEDIPKKRLMQVLDQLFPPKNKVFLSEKFLPEEEDWDKNINDVYKPPTFENESDIGKNKINSNSDILIELLLAHPELVDEIREKKGKIDLEM